MRTLTILFILIETFKLIGQDTSSATNSKKFIISAFASIVGNNETEYRKHIYDKEVLKAVATKSRQLNEEEDKKADEIIKIVYSKYLEEQSERYQSIQLKVHEFNINWKEIVFDSVSFIKSSNELGTIDGTLYFKKKDLSDFYKANFKGLIQHQKHFYIETLYVPYIYIGPKNRLLTSSIRQQYIDSCVSRANYLIHETKSNVLKAFYGDCIPCFCMKQYVSETEQSNGAETVRKNITLERINLTKKVR